MEITNFEQVVPSGGTFISQIFENPHIGLNPTLFFDIEIALSPFHFEGEEEQTSVILSFIKLQGVADWRSIEGKTFQFPVNPEEGYIDGSIYLGHTHVPADVTSISFGAIESGSVTCRLKIQFDFSYAGLENLGTPLVEWNVCLNVDEAQLDSITGDAGRLLG